LPFFIIFSPKNDGSSSKLSINPGSIMYLGTYLIRFKVTDTNSKRGEIEETIEG